MTYFRFAEQDGDVIKGGKTIVDAFDRYLVACFIVENIKEFSLNIKEGTYSVTAIDGTVIKGKVTEEK